MNVISYIVIGLLFFYTAYASFIGNVYGKTPAVIDAILIFILVISTLCASSDIEYVICLIGNIIFLVFELIDCVIYHSWGASACMHNKKKVYGLIILCCFLITIIFMLKHFS